MITDSLTLTCDERMTRLQMEQLFGVKKTEKKGLPAVETLKIKLQGCVDASVGCVRMGA